MKLNVAILLRIKSIVLVVNTTLLSSSLQSYPMYTGAFTSIILGVYFVAQYDFLS